jgi:hypothetical protein
MDSTFWTASLLKGEVVSSWFRLTAIRCYQLELGANFGGIAHRFDLPFPRLRLRSDFGGLALLKKGGEGWWFKGEAGTWSRNPGASHRSPPAKEGTRLEGWSLPWFRLTKDSILRELPHTAIT